MQLKELFQNIAGISFNSAFNPSLEVDGLSCDFKKIHPNFLYAAFTGETVDSDNFGARVDGRQFIKQAINNGASVILTDKQGHDHQTNPEVITITHANPNAVFSKIAANFFENQRPSVVACVTGTDGKTSTVNFCRQILHLLGKKAASIGNLGTIAGDDALLYEAVDPFSVPETVALYEMLYQLKLVNIDYVAMEATSHALFEERLAGVTPHIAAFSSFSRDHLDFHQTMEEYFKVKMKLFNEVLQKPGFAVINADIPEYSVIHQQCIARGIQVISYGYNLAANILLVKIESDFRQQKIFLHFQDDDYQVILPLPGEYQAKNLLCALGILIAAGFAIEQILSTVPQLQVIPGRMQKVCDYNGGQIFIDFAHTDDGLRALLKNIKEMTTGKVRLVFGAPGERDKGKRPLLGQVAATYADFIVITDDDPRSEDPALIRSEVAEACPGAHIIGDRREAIRFALQSIQKNDVLIVAGKGNVNGQYIGNHCFPFSDRDTIIELSQTKISS